MPDVKTRRDFLRTLFGLAAVGSAPFSLAALAAPAKEASATTCGAQSASAKTYKISQWTGDDFSLGHILRSGTCPPFPEHAEKSLDFIIVGGGIGGLTAAHSLKDQDFLLLEQYGQLGGQSRGGSFRGIDYSWGPAYISNVEGIYGKLYADLGINPEPLPKEDNAFFWHQKWCPGVSGSEPMDLYGEFKRLREDLAAGQRLLPEEDTPQAMGAPDVITLDETPFAALLKNYSPEFIALLDNILRSALCGGTTSVSAAIGIYLLSDLTSANYCFKGGNPAIARGLVSNLTAAGGERLRSGCFVWKITLGEGKASVFFTDKDGVPHHFSCKHVIVATPPMVAWRQFSNLPDMARTTLMPFHYGAYLVANFLMSKKTYNGAYDNFVGSPFTMADFTVAETPYKVAGTYKEGGPSVLTVYQPWEPGSAGRTLLLEGDRSKLSRQLHDQMSQLVSHLDENLEEIVLSRWGHAMPVVTPGYYKRLRAIMQCNNGPYSFAHSCTQGMPSAESAIRAGQFAAARAKAESTKISWQVDDLPTGFSPSAQSRR
jgi:protoporphyrinogen oxidase